MNDVTTCRLRILVVWLASLAPAAAQVQTGSMHAVRTTDEQNAVMPGVAVTISSPVLVSGAAPWRV